MKQGQLITRIVMYILLAALLIYFGVYALRALSDPLVTTRTYSYTVEDVLEVTGFVARAETVLRGPGTYIELLPDEGEKVAKGETVARLYRSADALERREELRELTAQAAELEEAVRQAGSVQDSARLSDEILESIAAVRTAAEGRELGKLSELTGALRSRVYCREYAYGGDVSGAERTLSELRERIRALGGADGAAETVTAPVPGSFSSLVDGMEEVLTPGRVLTMTCDVIDALTAPSYAESGAVGKLITDARWYFVCTVPADGARELYEGGHVTVRFSRDWSGEVDMRTERCEQYGDRLALVLSSTRHLADTTLLREQTVELIFSAQEGLRVPKAAVRTLTDTAEDGTTTQTTGVYAVVGAQAEFKKAIIVGEGEDFFLLAAPEVAPDAASQAKRALRAGDEIIIRAENLYDGKVVRAG